MKENIQKINKSDLSLQDKVRKNPKDCDHIGFFTPLGYEVFQNDNSNSTFKIVSSVLCMMCGKIFHQIADLEQNEETN